MTEKQIFINALERKKPVGKVPTFELVFFLTMQKYGKVHPSHRNYNQWGQMSALERSLHVKDIARLYVDTAGDYGHSAILVHFNPGGTENIIATLEAVREISGDKYFLMMHGDCTLSIPDGDSMTEFAAMMYEEPETLKARQQKMIEGHQALVDELAKRKGLLDGFALCSDYAFNVNPFFSPDIFADIVAPYLEKNIKMYREAGFCTIKHTDGNINPILDQIVECRPDALHSVDPQGHMNLKDVREKYGKKIATIGNVNCGLLQTGGEEECIGDINRCIDEGMADGGAGFIFSTSNCVYTGLSLERYELMMDIYKKRLTGLGERPV
jgi:uroporphyrinogen decarboxylase